MRSVRARIGLSLLPALAMGAPAMGARHSGQRLARYGPCHVRGSKLLYRKAAAQVVRGQPLPGGIDRTDPQWNVYSCVSRSRAHRLFSIGAVDRRFDQSIDHVVLAGRFGAFHITTSAIDPFDCVAVFDLATGRRIAQDVNASTYFRALTALVLDGTGTAAWAYSSTIDSAGMRQPPGTPVELWGASTIQAATTLDTGAIDPASVAVSANVVTWTDAGTSRMADLGGRTHPPGVCV